jgi:hypothetical protein
MEIEDAIQTALLTLKEGYEGNLSLSIYFISIENAKIGY